MLIERNAGKPGEKLIGRLGGSLIVAPPSPPRSSFFHLPPSFHIPSSFQTEFTRFSLSLSPSSFHRRCLINRHPSKSTVLTTRKGQLAWRVFSPRIGRMRIVSAVKRIEGPRGAEQSVVSIIDPGWIPILLSLGRILRRSTSKTKNPSSLSFSRSLT